MQLQIRMPPDVLAERLRCEVLAGRVNIVEIVEQVLEEQFALAAKEQLGGRLVKPATAVVHASYFKSRFATLADLAENGYYTWYPEVRFATKPSDRMDSLEVEPNGLVLGTIRMNQQELRHRLFVKALKTQVNHTLRLNRVDIPSTSFRSSLDCLSGSGQLPQPFIANLALGPGLDGYRLVAFDHVLTGRRLFCECARGAHRRMLESARAIVSGFEPGSWPCHVIELLSAPEYQADICHLCIAAREGPQVAMQRYGPAVATMLDPYTEQISRSQSVDERTARADVQARLGVSKWVRETELYVLVKQLLPDKTVLREASPAWLGQLRLDVYVPELKLALEHQGQQHYEAVSVFGGQDALLRTQARDDQKRRLCEENGVRLICVRYDEPLTERSLRRRIEQQLKLARF